MKIAIIDAYNLLFRSYYALPALKNSRNTPTGAVFGFINILIKYLNNRQPDGLIIATDNGRKNFRHDIYIEYKANRQKPPQDLIDQFPILFEALDALGLATITRIGYEADDIIATLVKRFKNCEICSSDKDLIQLINSSVVMYDPFKNLEINAEYVLEKFGVQPEYFTDYLALTGDASDNIPGVQGIGPKTASNLISEFKSIEQIKENITNIKRKKIAENLTIHYDKALLSKRLVQLCSNVDIPDEINTYYKKQDIDKIKKLIEKYEFNSISQNIIKTFTESEPQIINNSIDDISSINIEEFIKNCNISGKISLYISKDEKIIIYNGRQRSVILQYSEISLIREILESVYILKIGFDIKQMLHFFARYSCKINSFNDIMLMHNLINSNFSLDTENDENNIAMLLFESYHSTMQSIVKNRLVNVYQKLERPMIQIVYEMEKVGMLVDKAELEKTSDELELLISQVQSEIYEYTEQEFNIASVKQLSNILFEQLKLPKINKSSTDAEVLEKLAANGIEVADKILEWRSLTKLKNTYTDPLIRSINPDTNRIHTQYILTGTSTGRLASMNPNLQNIPVRKNYSIRNAFIAPENTFLISADYSQIELRLLTYFANVPSLNSALESDIHSITAMGLFNTSSVTEEMRRKAKSINFGIIYGITPFGLSKQLNISLEESSIYIKKYFEKYPGIKDYMEYIKQYAYDHGYIETIFGRRCYIPEIKSKNSHRRKFAERAAINAPLQGSTADLMRKSMILLKRQLPEIKIIAQIHDELIFEVIESDVENTSKIISQSMQDVTDKLKLVVEIKIGKKWGSLEKIKSL